MKEPSSEAGPPPRLPAKRLLAPTNRPRKVQTTGYSAPGRPEVWLEPDRLYTQPILNAVVEPEDWAGGVRLELWIDISETGKPSCRHLAIQATEDASITWQLLKEIGVPTIMQIAMRESWRHDPETGQVGAADPVEMEERYPATGRGKPRTDEFLARIRKRYRQLIEEGCLTPVKIIAEEETVDRSTARSWLGKAVDKSERLSPADGGRARKGSGSA